MYAGGHVSDALAGLRDRAIVAMAGVGFTVDEIRIEGNERTDAADIRAALAIDEGEPIFAIDTAAARERLGRLPWVADAVVRRRFPGLVAVRLIEKRPFAIWEIGSAHVVVERSGAVIDGVAPTAADRLPLLIGPGAPEAAAPLIDSLSVQRAVSARLVAVERISERRWDIILDRGVRVRLPESDWEAQLVELERLIVDRGLLERDLEIIDLRFPDSYIFQLHNGDSQPVSRETPV
jgi:cell division protein FtsQ